MAQTQNIEVKLTEVTKFVDKLNEVLTQLSEGFDELNDISPELTKEFKEAYFTSK